MGNKDTKYAAHQEPVIEKVMKSVEPFGDKNSSASGSFDANSEILKDPRSPTAEINRLSFYNKLTNRNDRAYTQLSTIADDVHCGEGSGDRSEVPETKLNTSSGSHNALATSSRVDSATDNQAVNSVSGAPISNGTESSASKPAMSSSNGSSSTPHKQFPRLAISLVSGDRSAGKYSQIGSCDD